MQNIYKNRIYMRIVLPSFSEACSFSCSGSCQQFRPRPTFWSEYTRNNQSKGRHRLVFKNKKRSKFIDKSSKIYSLNVNYHTTINSFHFLPIKTNIFVKCILHSINIQRKQTDEDWSFYYTYCLPAVWCQRGVGKLIFFLGLGDVCVPKICP